MAICPYCHVMDKRFFAPKCHACNTSVGFIEQVVASTIYTTAVLVMFFGFFALLAQCQSG